MFDGTVRECDQPCLERGVAGQVLARQRGQHTQDEPFARQEDQFRIVGRNHRTQALRNRPAGLAVIENHRHNRGKGAEALRLALRVARPDPYLVGMFCLSESICDISRLFNWLPGNDSDNVLPRIRPMT